jgi:alkylhydroperoxidase family enzyme
VVESVYENRATASVEDRTKVALKLVEKMTLRPGEVVRADIDELRKAGISNEAIVDVASITGLFNLIDRLADSFRFRVPTDEAFERGSAGSRQRGYLLPGPFVWGARR